METPRSPALDRPLAPRTRAPTVTAFAAQAAELDGLVGMGALAVRTDGFRRCEGMFHCRLADRDKVVALMTTGASFRGIIYRGATDIGRRRVRVMIRAFRTQPDGLMLQLRAAGDWWRTLEAPLTGDAL